MSPFYVISVYQYTSFISLLNLNFGGKRHEKMTYFVHLSEVDFFKVERIM